MVKNSPAVPETQVSYLSCEDPLEKKGMATHSQYSCLENSVNRGAWRATGPKEKDTTERLSLLFKSLSTLLPT
jgi:hypothetical protein